MTHYRQKFIRQNLVTRSCVLQSIRSFFHDKGYIEIETPVRIPAPAPEANIDAFQTEEWFLHTSPELCMKRLLAAGYTRIFQICKCFRKEERGRIHLPEFTVLEWYTAGHTYLDMMNQCEDLIQFAADACTGKDHFFYKSEKIMLSSPWDRISVSDAFAQFSKISMEEALHRDCLDEVMALEIEPFLGKTRPVFLYDYPSSCAALARTKPGSPHVAERFELYIGGLEICNAFTELTDLFEQRSRFIKELSDRKNAGKIEYPMPERFLEALDDMPASTGNALGIDRILLLMTGAETIDEVVAFTPEEL